MLEILENRYQGGRTLLHIAVQDGNTALLSLLLTSKIDLWKTDDNSNYAIESKGLKECAPLECTDKEAQLFTFLYALRHGRCNFTEPFFSDHKKWPAQQDLLLALAAHPFRYLGASKPHISAFLKQHQPQLHHKDTDGISPWDTGIMHHNIAFLRVMAQTSYLKHPFRQSELAAYQGTNVFSEEEYKAYTAIPYTKDRLHSFALTPFFIGPSGQCNGIVTKYLEAHQRKSHTLSPDAISERFFAKLSSLIPANKDEQALLQDELTTYHTAFLAHALPNWSIKDKMHLQSRYIRQENLRFLQSIMLYQEGYQSRQWDVPKQVTHTDRLLRDIAQTLSPDYPCLEICLIDQFATEERGHALGIVGEFDRDGTLTGLRLLEPNLGEFTAPKHALAHERLTFIEPLMKFFAWYYGTHYALYPKWERTSTECADAEIWIRPKVQQLLEASEPNLFKARVTKKRAQETALCL